MFLFWLEEAFSLCESHIVHKISWNHLLKTKIDIFFLWQNSSDMNLKIGTTPIFRPDCFCWCWLTGKLWHISRFVSLIWGGAILTQKGCWEAMYMYYIYKPATSRVSGVNTHKFCPLRKNGVFLTYFLVCTLNIWCCTVKIDW